MSQNYAHLVNPYIGTLAPMLKSVVPEVKLPYSVTRTCPKGKTAVDFIANDEIEGFPLGTAMMLPTADRDRHTNTIDHSMSEVHAHRSRFVLEDGEILTDSSVTPHGYIYQVQHAEALHLTFDANTTANLDNDILYLHRQLTQEQAWPYELPDEYIVVQFDQTALDIEMRERGVTIVGFDAEQITVGAAVSYISFEQALDNFHRELKDLDLERIAGDAEATWNRLLGQIHVEGNTEDRQRVFYTAMVRAFQRMTDYGEYGRYYSNFSRKVEDGDYFYTNDGLWDTFRCMHPLQLLLNPSTKEKMLHSYNLMYEQSDLMPSFPGPHGDIPCMIGFHAASIFLDAYRKGLDVDYEKAYQGIRKNALEQCMLPWVCDREAGELDQVYYEQGFFPALRVGEAEYVPYVHGYEQRQAISVTLEHAYDDWCAGQLAEALGYHEDAERFAARAQNYRNLYRDDLKLMAPRSADGQWVEGYDPLFGGGQGGRDYFTENNAYVCSWTVLHDIEGLAQLMGGEAVAEAQLDHLFTYGFVPESRGPKFQFLGQFPDSTGLMGQFTMGNEPGFHIPYIYSMIGAPWKAQKRLRTLMDTFFIDSPLGICGDEDGGAMSSWLVFSALGFYPVCPGKPEYVIGTPWFDRATIRWRTGERSRCPRQVRGTGRATSSRRP